MKVLLFLILSLFCRLIEGQCQNEMFVKYDTLAGRLFQIHINNEYEKVILNSDSYILIKFLDHFGSAIIELYKNEKLKYHVEYLGNKFWIVRVSKKKQLKSQTAFSINTNNFYLPKRNGLWKIYKNGEIVKQINYQAGKVLFLTESLN